MHKTIAGMTLVVLLAAGAQQPEALAQDTVYKWTDQEGVTHYTARPPEDVEYEIVDIITRERVRGGQSNPAPADETESSAPSIPPEQPEMAPDEPDPELVAERCEQARRNIENLTTRNNVLIRGENDERRQITEEEREGMIEDARQFMDEWC